MFCDWLWVYLIVWYPVWLFELLILFTCLKNFCDKDNKSVWTIIIAVPLMFVPAVAASNNNKMSCE